MKCDELQYERLGEANWAYPASTLVIRKQFVDEAIAELKTEIKRKEAVEQRWFERCMEARAENVRLKRELEHVKNGDCINTCDVVEKHVKEEIKAKRALWLARAERAKEMCQRLLIQGFDPKWQEVERKCRAKAEEYK